jgi:NAD(P)-dependent dehydrogenase (short-subunit alcohol dehydrogenase family)
VYSLNVKAPFFLAAELAPLMAKRGKGAIVNVSTMVADYGVSGMSLYGSNKAAINLLTNSWAAEYGPHGVRVNAVSPGPIRTEGTEAMGEGVEQLAARRPRAARQRRTRLPRLLFSWRPIAPVSFIGRNSPSMAAEPPFEMHGGGRCLTWSITRSSLSEAEKQESI